MAANITRTGSNQILAELHRTESRRIFALLVHHLKDFDIAEDALAEAFAAASLQWPVDGIPSNPRSWLISTGRFKGIDVIRRRERHRNLLPDLAEHVLSSIHVDVWTDDILNDEQLRLIFVCNNPALSPEARVALTLREVCGLSTEDVARAFLTTPTTIAQRIVRAKTKIRTAGIPYQIPEPSELPERLNTVLHVIYLVFTEGYSDPWRSGDNHPNLCDEAVRLGRLIHQLMPCPDTAGLLALMLLQDSRFEARVSTGGEIVLLEDQDRSKWNRAKIEEGKRLVEKALSNKGFSAYAVQAAIAALHAEAKAADETDWNQIVGLYTILLQTTSSPVIELNRAVAIAMRDGPEAGIRLIEVLMSRGELDEYFLAHSAIANLYRRAGKNEKAKEAYRRALALTKRLPEVQFLESRLEKLS